MLVRGNSLILPEQDFVVRAPARSWKRCSAACVRWAARPARAPSARMPIPFPKIIAELVAVRNSERENRVIDHDREGSMEMKKREGISKWPRCTQNDHARRASSISRVPGGGAVQGPAAPDHRRQRRRRQVHPDRPPVARRARRLRRSAEVRPAAAARSISRCSPTACAPSASRASPSTSPTAISPRRNANSFWPTRRAMSSTRATWPPAHPPRSSPSFCATRRAALTTQSRRHAYIAALLGIPHFVIAVNKMDLVGLRAKKFSTRSARSSSLS